jgi:hypothetical protein
LPITACANHCTQVPSVLREPNFVDCPPISRPPPPPPWCGHGRPAAPKACLGHEGTCSRAATTHTQQTDARMIALREVLISSGPRRSCIQSHQRPEIQAGSMGSFASPPSNDVDPLRFLLQLSPAPYAFAVVQQLIPLRYTRRRGTCMRGLLQSQTRCLSHHLLRSQTVPCAMAERRGIDCATNGCTLRVSRLICSPASSACATTTCYRFKCAMLCFIVSDCPRRAC